jgi:hypothetical protein
VFAGVVDGHSSFVWRLLVDVCPLLPYPHRQPVLCKFLSALVSDFLHL